jgi:hypothetical protein
MVPQNPTTLVAEMDWDTFYDAKPIPDARAAWRAAVADVAERAKAQLPASHGRIDAAVRLVLSGDVEILEDGSARVGSGSDGSRTYHQINGECSCVDFVKAPQSMCKHRVAFGIQKRATTLAKAKLATLDAPVADQEAPGDPPSTAPVDPQMPTIPAQFLVQIQGKPFVKFAGLLHIALAAGLVSLTAEWTYNDADLSLAHAVAVFADGRRFEESGDAEKGNVNPMVAKHFRRVALTRSKARCLRDAIGCDLVSVEEMD